MTRRNLVIRSNLINDDCRENPDFLASISIRVNLFSLEFTECNT